MTFDSSAGVPPSVPSASSGQAAGASRPRFGEVHIRDRGRLPHWEKESATYFITFRLADSLPKSVLERIESEREAIFKTANQLHRPLTSDERKKVQRLSTPIVEEYLDRSAGSCSLKNPAVADALPRALQHFDDKRYRLFAWCVMPNHVHVVARLFPSQTLAAVVHSWKSFTAKRANEILETQGTFWQREYYDHLVRDQEELGRAIQYVADNPKKGNLQHWRWVWVCGRDAHTTAAEDGGATRP